MTFWPELLSAYAMSAGGRSQSSSQKRGPANITQVITEMFRISVRISEYSVALFVLGKNEGKRGKSRDSSSHNPRIADSNSAKATNESSLLRTNAGSPFSVVPPGRSPHETQPRITVMIPWSAWAWPLSCDVSGGCSLGPNRSVGVCEDAHAGEDGVNVQRNARLPLVRREEPARLGACLGGQGEMDRVRRIAPSSRV